MGPPGMIRRVRPARPGGCAGRDLKRVVPRETPRINDRTLHSLLINETVSISFVINGGRKNIRQKLSCQSKRSQQNPDSAWPLKPGLLTARCIIPMLQPIPQHGVPRETNYNRGETPSACVMPTDKVRGDPTRPNKQKGGYRLIADSRLT